MNDELFEPFIDGYSISNFGRVRNDKTDKFRTLQERNKHLGPYKSVNIRGVNYSIHRLVAQHFVINPKPLEYKVVNHKDNDPANNHYLNLEWCTQKMNIGQQLDLGTHTSLWNEDFKQQQNTSNTPAKAHRKKTVNSDLPIGVSERKYVTKGIRYIAKMGNEKCGQVYLGTYDTAEEAYEKVKEWYFEQYGEYP